ncbi:MULTISPECIES: peptidase C39 family protein [Streptomyces]|uniref:Peptidase C39 family protein n=1 Tax=Streptomyces morookaense TaxID=1970 RepID=A0A7Y7B6F3_STRMO|nr:MULTISPECIES: peptidase C39 family protein [Streptomyces]MCC2276568.1 peptidase C39 family protein [Streptomyces sp. ET3-23]NVK79898.1 peptidase C39 family protein [Streptomyces morookaense]
MSSRATPRRTVLAAALALAAASTPVATAAPRAEASVDYRAWTTYPQWAGGRGAGTRVLGDGRPGLCIAHALGTRTYADPHTHVTAEWEYATWSSPVHTLPAPATEIVVSWNAHAPAGTWLQAELRAAYNDRTQTPWYVMGRWTAGDGTGDIRRTSVDGQSDRKSGVSTDTLAVSDASSGLRLVSYELRLTLYRKPGTTLTPTVWRLGAMASAVPDRFTVPASRPGEGAGHRLTVPRYSQEIHKGQYPQYDNGGEAWCSPTSSQMVLEYWGRKPSPRDLAWVDPSYADPQVCHAARFTYDYQYQGCGNWPFNAAYAATYHDMQAVITRLRTLNEAERLVRAGIPVITSQSFLASELDGAGYGTAGHLMCVTGFTRSGDVVVHDPAAKTDAEVERVYKRRQFENIWLRTKRRNAQGQVRSGSGGVCYLYFPTRVSPAQRRALASVGVR